jgi:hypothetical protein
MLAFWTGNLRLNLVFTWLCIVIICLIIKPTRCTNFSNLFWNEILYVSHSSSVHHQEFFTVHTTMVYVIPFCGQLASSIRMEFSSILILLASCLHICMTYTTAVCTVKNSWWWTEELSETCRAPFQNKIEKLVHLGVYIIRNLYLNILKLAVCLNNIWNSVLITEKILPLHSSDV